MAGSAKSLGGAAVDSLPPPNGLSRYKGGGAPMEPDEDDGAGDEAMGSAFADAVKSGNGAAITAAFRDLQDHCSGMKE